MRFEVTISDHQKANVCLKGFVCLEDACAAAVGMRGVRSDDFYISIYAAKRGRHELREHLGSAYPGASYQTCLARCQMQLTKMREKRRLADARWKFLTQYPHGAFGLICADEPTRLAFYRNEFEPVRAFLAAREAVAA